jgi:hypothetical protein
MTRLQFDASFWRSIGLVNAPARISDPAKAGISEPTTKRRGRPFGSKNKNTVDKPSSAKGVISESA